MGILVCPRRLLWAGLIVCLTAMLVPAAVLMKSRRDQSCMRAGWRVFIGKSFAWVGLLL